jgi:UDP-glucose:(heptosyl)LPS alpha-1,3-glucosyltransferase
MHFAGRGYRKLIVTTPQVREDLGRIYGVPNEDVAIVPNGFDADEFNPHRCAQRRNESRDSLSNVGSQTVVLLMVANELERKGYVQTLRAVRALAREIDVQLVLVGRANRDSALRLAEREGVRDRVFVAGATSDVSFYHAAADLFVLPTQYEALSLAILESLASGLPVITTRVAGAMDAVQDGINGRLVCDPLDDVELTQVLREAVQPRRLEMLRHGTENSVAAFAWPVVLARYEAVLAEVC